jgi:hypothetical protein
MAHMIAAQRAREFKPHKSGTEIMENSLKRGEKPARKYFMNFSFGKVLKRRVESSQGRERAGKHNKIAITSAFRVSLSQRQFYGERRTRTFIAGAGLNHILYSIVQFIRHVKYYDFLRLLGELASASLPQLCPR